MGSYSQRCNISELLGHIVRKIDYDDENIITFYTDTHKFSMYHDQDCCESVYLEDICGDLSDLIGNPIWTAEESSSDEPPPNHTTYPPESYTWTFYTLGTIKGSVTLRWYGESNGYYSESVSVYKIPLEKKNV